MQISTLLRSALAVLLVAALAACGEVTGTGDPNVAATVGDADITITEVEEQFERVSKQPQLAQQLEQDTEGTYRKQLQAQVLTQLVFTSIFEQWAEELDITVTDEEVDEERAEVVEQLGGEEQLTAAAEQAGLSSEEVNDELRSSVLQDKVVEEVGGDAEVSDEDIEAFYQENQATRFSTKARARHILVETEAKAKELLKQIENGADFAEIAMKESTDEGSGAQGGDLGEFDPAQMAPPFAQAVLSANIGQVVGPVRTQFGFHLIEVQERTDAQELEDAREEIRSELQAGQREQAFQEKLQQRAKDAEITVNPRFGVWDPESGQVQPEPPLGEASEVGGPSESTGVPSETGTVPPSVPTEIGTE